MKFLTESDVKEFCDLKEEMVKNSWRWAWLEEKNVGGDKFESWCKKIDIRPMPACCKTLQYGSSGKKTLHKHADDPTHLQISFVTP